MLLSYPWDMGALGSFWTGRAQGAASVLLCRCVHTKTLWPELHSDAFLCTCWKHGPRPGHRGRLVLPRSSGVSSVALLPLIRWAPTALQKGPLAILGPRAKSATARYCFWSGSSKGGSVFPWDLHMLTLIHVPTFSSDNLILESALLFWWLCLDACVWAHLASLFWARGMD